VKTADRALAITGCCLALGTLVPIALFQGEVTDALPDPPGAVFASERITLSAAAHPLGVPDSFLGLASYGTTLALVLLAEKSVVAKRLLGAKLVADAGLASFNMVRQVVSFRKLCSWCTGTALATGLVVYGGREAVAESAKAVAKAV
jgi:uncharacterized membrane protein